MSAGQWLAAIGAILAIGGAVIAGVAWGRGNVLRATNEMLAKALEQQRDYRAEIEERCDAQVADLQAQIDRLRGIHPDGPP